MSTKAEQPCQHLHSLTFLRDTERMIWARLGRNVSLEDLSETELEQIAFMARDPANANNTQLSKALNEALRLE